MTPRAAETTAPAVTARSAGSGSVANASPLRTAASVSTTCGPGGGPHSSGGAGPKITTDGTPYAEAR